MTFWEKTKTFFTLVGANIKKYGFLIGAVIFLVVYIIVTANNKQRVEAMMNLIAERDKIHRKAIEDIQRERNEELKKRQEIQRLYDETIAKINKEHAEQLARLTADKEKELRSIIEQTHNDPILMADRVNNLFGIELYRS